MARKPARVKADPPTTESDRPTGSDRERIVAIFMTLLAEKPIERIDLTEIAAGADVSLGALRGEFPSKLAMLAAHVKAIDRAVLEGGDGDMAEEPPRERLFDVLMRRIELLAPHKEALASLLRSARRNPGLALALNAMAVRSQQWMLAAAGLHSSGPLGMARAQGLAVLFARVLRTFVHDDDEGHARTMAELDRGLGRGARLLGVLGDLCRFVPGGGRSRRRPRRDWDDEQDDEATAAA
jgi:AcrR family transcriptional regulator